MPHFCVGIDEDICGHAERQREVQQYGRFGGEFTRGPFTMTWVVIKKRLKSNEISILISILFK